MRLNYPSFANSNVGGVANTTVHSFDPSTVDNANGTSSGFSVLADADDLLADGSATYITQIRDFGSTVTGQVQLDIKALNKFKLPSMMNFQQFIQARQTHQLLVELLMLL